MQRTAAVLFAISLTHLVGCATIFTGTTEEISITSEPSGASISLRPTGGSAVTPANLTLSKKNTYIVRARLACFEEETAQIDNQIHPLFFGNILIGGLIGLLIDVGGGGGFDLEPEQIHFQLKKLPDCPAEEPPPDTAQDDALQPTQRRLEEGNSTEPQDPRASAPDEIRGEDVQPASGEIESKQNVESEGGQQGEAEK